MTDAVNHPGHYADVVPGLECIQVTQHFNFNRGNAIKYLWRAGAKGDAIEDLRKAIKYCEFEIARIQAERAEMRQGLLAGLGLDSDNVHFGTLTEEPKRRPRPGARILQFRPRP